MLDMHATASRNIRALRGIDKITKMHAIIRAKNARFSGAGSSIVCSSEIPVSFPNGITAIQIGIYTILQRDLKLVDAGASQTGLYTRRTRCLR